MTRYVMAAEASIDNAPWEPIEITVTSTGRTPTTKEAVRELKNHLALHRASKDESRVRVRGMNVRELERSLA